MNTLQQGSSSDAQAARRSFMASALALAGLASGQVAGAERWPSRPITVVSTGPAGSGPDTRARELFTHIGMALGQPIVVENMPGAGGIIAMEQVRRASPDGHRFIFTHIGAVVINPSLIKALPYDPVRDFDPVSLVLESPMILVDTVVARHRVAGAVARSGQAQAGHADVCIGRHWHATAHVRRTTQGRNQDVDRSCAIQRLARRGAGIDGCPGRDRHGRRPPH